MSETYSDCLLLAKTELMRAQALLADEIRSYPTPISGCDAQFNHMIGERERIGSAINALGQHIFVPTPRSPSLGAGIESR